MNKAYARINNGNGWKNYPSIETPINEQNLNKQDIALDIIDDRVIALDTNKATKIEVSTLISEVAYNEATGIITFTRKNGATVTIDTKLEKLAINFGYDPVAEQLVITLDDGTKQYVDLSALITQYEFLDSDTIAFQLQPGGKVKAIVKEGSIEEKHLRPNYLADIKVEVGKAGAAAESAERNAQAAAKSEEEAKKSEVAAAESAQVAQDAADSVAGSTERAENAANQAESSAQASANSATDAAGSAQAAAGSATEAAGSAQDAADSEAAAQDSKEDAANSALLSQSWAVGGTGIREGEETDNSKYYCQQAHGFRDEAEHFSQSAENAVEQINKKLEMAEFSIDDDGNLIYTDGSSYNFTVDENGDLNWEVAA